jgi:hypothetical protein|tara:strand:+ start:8257 stop:8649 length:393 start_codon:yes stop_codon:yes gene_type:complete
MTMTKMQRNKGSQFERWCCNEIKDHLGYENVRRNLSQYQEKGGADILIPHWSIECKRYATGPHGGADAWWQQAVNAAGDLSPLLIYKYDRHEPVCKLFLCDVNKEFTGTDATVLVSLPTWFYIVREAIPF